MIQKEGKEGTVLMKVWIEQRDGENDLVYYQNQSKYFQKTFINKRNMIEVIFYIY